MAGMVLSMACYGKSKSKKINEIVDYILLRQMKDGGWNCRWHQKPAPHVSSVHTTLSVLEGMKDYEENGYTYRLDELKEAMEQGIKVLLKRHLYKSFKDGKPLYTVITKATFPPRWKYDILKALEFFVSIKRPYDVRMKDAIDLLKSSMKGPLMRRGSRHQGLIHFPIENKRYGYFNTLRMLKVLRQYDKTYYNHLLTLEIDIKDVV